MTPARRSRADRLARIAGDAVTALLLAAIALAAFVFYGLLDNRWYHVVAVTGGSMSPAIEAGDLIVITRPPPRIEPGMILTLEVDGSVVTHRVDEVRVDGSFVTKGDANTVRDDFSSNVVRVVGEYRFRIPVLGSILAQARAIASGAYFAANTGVTTDIQVGVDPGVNAEPDALPQTEPAPNDVAAPALTDGVAAAGPGAPESTASPVPAPDAGPDPSADPPPDLDEPEPSGPRPEESAPPAPPDQESAPPVAIDHASNPPATVAPEPADPVPTDPPPIEPEPDEPTPTEPAPAPAEPLPGEPDPPDSDISQ